jgi:uncharacterized SAM-binding protein YcdF (DUF218 family)
MDFIFLVKKIISVFVMPLSIGIVALIIAFVFLLQNKNFKGKMLLAVGILWISLFSYTPFANMLLLPLENYYPKLKNIPNDIKFIVYLGGDQQNRGWEVLRLYYKIPNAKIITSGYAGIGGIVPEAIKTANVLNSVGIKSKDIIILPTPKDTYQEALKMKKILKDQTFILVTSAYHLPRAMMIFNSIGLKPIPAPTDFLIKDSDNAFSFVKSTQLNKSTKAWHEYIGILWFKLKELIHVV